MKKMLTLCLVGTFLFILPLRPAVRAQEAVPAAESHDASPREEIGTAPKVDGQCDEGLCGGIYPCCTWRDDDCWCSYCCMALQEGEFAMRIPSSDLGAASAKANAKDTFVHLSPDQMHLLSEGVKAEKEEEKKTCEVVCTGCRTVCIPGCDPPDENDTVRGCSPCYSREIVCRECHLECK